MRAFDKSDNRELRINIAKFLKDSVRISIKTQIRLICCSKAAQIVYWAIINEMNKNEYEVTIDRNTLKKVTGLSDSSISLAIKELTTNKDADENYEPLVECISKNTYYIPIDQCVKGSINIIMQKEKQKKEELIALKEEREAIDRITEFCLKLRSKPLIKKQSNESKD